MYKIPDFVCSNVLLELSLKTYRYQLETMRKKSLFEIKLCSLLSITYFPVHLHFLFKFLVTSNQISSKNTPTYCLKPKPNIHECRLQNCCANPKIMQCIKIAYKKTKLL